TLCHLSPAPLTARSFPPLFLFTAPPTTAIYTLSLHDALPISRAGDPRAGGAGRPVPGCAVRRTDAGGRRHARRARVQQHQSGVRSEEHTSELQSLRHLVCRLLLEKKKKKQNK